MGEDCVAASGYFEHHHAFRDGVQLGDFCAGQIEEFLRVRALGFIRQSGADAEVCGAEAMGDLLFAWQVGRP